jgi:hypothetical protein
VTAASCCLEMIQGMVPLPHCGVSFRARADGPERLWALLLQKTPP